jgi:hypothetical protein
MVHSLRCSCSYLVALLFPNLRSLLESKLRANFFSFDLPSLARGMRRFPTLRLQFLQPGVLCLDILVLFGCKGSTGSGVAFQLRLGSAGLLASTLWGLSPGFPINPGNGVDSAEFIALSETAKKTFDWKTEVTTCISLSPDR